MRVLWFSNKIPVGASSSKKSVGGSWIESLEKELMHDPNMELGIVYTQLSKIGKKTTSNESSTRYFMVPKHPYGKFARWISRFAVTPFSEKPLKDYLQIVQDFHPDIVLFFGTESDFPLIIPQLKIPSIIWFQGNLTVYERMYQNGISIRATLRHEKLKALLKGDSILHNYLNFKRKVVREKKIFSVAENFIGRTNWDKRVVSVMAPKANYFHCDEAMRKIFWKNEWSSFQDREKFIITTTIRGNLYKGLETVFECCQLLSDRGLNVEWRVLGINSSSAYVRSARRKTKLNLRDTNVKLLGSKSGSELVDELLNADLYVHPSHIENSPNGVQEAMLLGMPVIATNVGGTPSLLVDGEEGLLVQNKDPFAMAGAILELYHNPKKAESLGKNARKRGVKRNDSLKICADLVSIFEQLTRQKNLSSHEEIEG